MAAKNKHLDHLEDRIILEGSKGGKEAITALREMGKFLSGKPGPGMLVTTKWDGAPAIICGYDPEDGKFFVGTKSVFAKEPKLMKTPEDIKNNYSGALAEKLLQSLKYLPNVVKKGVLQGDLMFTDDKKTERIDGEQFITFRPNTITYAAKPNTPLGKDINRAKLGIVFHTKYIGNSIADMSASFQVTDNDFKATADVWAEKATFKDISGAANFTTSERQKYESAINKAEGSIRKASRTLDQIQSGKKALKMDTEFLKFFNNYVKEGRDVPSVQKAYEDYYKHLYKEYDKVAKKYKTSSSVDKKVAEYLKVVTFIEENKEGFKMVIAAYMNLQKAKMMLVERMKKVGQLRLFVDMGGGDYKVTDPEGFVAVVNDKATKLIDRMEFSKLNFTVPKVW